jgi:two-component system sensor histidine kinase TctE
VTAPSLRKQLLGWLLGPLVVLLVGSAIASYVSGLAVATEAYDRSLLDPALAIASRLTYQRGRIEVDLPPAALDVLRADSSDRIFFSASVAGRHIAGATDISPPPSAPRPDAPVFYDGFAGDEPVRIAALVVAHSAGPVLIQMAETRVKRTRLIRQVLLSSAVPEILFVVAALVAVWIGIARGLGPLERLRSEIASRSRRDMRPVDETATPAEVRPVIAELNRLLARLDASMQAQERFIADAAHQLRTPLAALDAQIEAASRRNPSEEMRDALGNLHVASQRATHLARQLLTLARVDPHSGHATRLEPVDLAAVVEAGMFGWVQQADAASVDLGFDLQRAPISGDAALLQELVDNLVDNACLHAGREAAVTVRTGVAQGRAFLEIEDDGPGIPASERERVFERFHRVQGTAALGSGLGLAIVREIAARHGATASAHAGIDGRGTRIRVEFPAAAERS